MMEPEMLREIALSVRVSVTPVAAVILTVAIAIALANRPRRRADRGGYERGYVDGLAREPME
jgi:hypothetical protein